MFNSETIIRTSVSDRVTDLFSHSVKPAMDSEKVTIQISKKLYDKIQDYIKRLGGFNSVEEFVEFVLGEVLTEEEEKTTYSKEDEEKIKERLRALGYI